MYVCVCVCVCVCVYIYCVCVCVCVCTRTYILAYTHKHACTHSVGVVCVRRVSKTEELSEITILPACSTSELLNLLTDCHATLYERYAL